MLQVHNTKNHLKRASKEMHLIWRKSGKSLLPAHPSLLILLLRNIINGIVAWPDVNVHDFEPVGNKIIEDIIGKSAFTYKFKRKDRAKNPWEYVGSEYCPDRTIDPALLFQRFLVMSR